MKKRQKLLVTLIALLLIGAGAFLAVAIKPAIDPVDKPDVALTPALVAEGARVVALGDCIVCHTAPGGAEYAGGLPLKTPFGIIYTTNITPDRATGIGTWSLDAFRRALREGVSRDGHLLYPAFPYIHYTKVTDEDIKAAYVFLMTRPAVDAPDMANQLPSLCASGHRWPSGTCCICAKVRSRRQATPQSNAAGIWWKASAIARPVIRRWASSAGRKITSTCRVVSWTNGPPLRSINS